MTNDQHLEEKSVVPAAALDKVLAMLGDLSQSGANDDHKSRSKKVKCWHFDHNRKERKKERAEIDVRLEILCFSKQKRPK